MKKYNKLTSLVLLITLVFTSFFIWKAQATSPNPKVNIVTIEGNAEHLKPVELYANISNNIAYGNHPVFQLENNKVDYVDNRPFSQKIDGDLNPFINRLISQHRSFMRGKSRRPDQYIVTDDWIVYTAMATDIYWQESTEDEIIISILNKKTKEEKEYTINLGDNLNYFDLHTAYLNYPELSIALTKYDMNGEAEHLMSTFDFENPETELTERINFTNQIEQEEYFFAGNNLDKTGRFVPFQSLKTVQRDEEIYDDFYTDSSITTGYFVYDIEDRKIIDIPLFEENETFLFVDQNKIYLAEDLGETFKFYEVNPNNEKLEVIGTIEMASSPIDPGQNYSYNEFDNQKMSFLDGKLYIYNQQEYKGAILPVFQVIDIENQETLFIGRLDASTGAHLDAPNIDVIEYRLNSIAN